MSTNQVKILVLSALGLLLVGVLAVGGFVYFGWGLFTDQVRAVLDANPVVQEHVGVVEELEFEFEATGEYEDPDVFVFRVSGPRGSGLVSAKLVSVDADTEELQSGTLHLDSGEVFELLPEETPPDPPDVGP